jgi:hypothetical protein
VAHSVGRLAVRRGASASLTEMTCAFQRPSARARAVSTRRRLASVTDRHRSSRGDAAPRRILMGRRPRDRAIHPGRHGSGRGGGPAPIGGTGPARGHSWWGPRFTVHARDEQHAAVLATHKHAGRGPCRGTYRAAPLVHLGRYQVAGAATMPRLSLAGTAAVRYAAVMARSLDQHDNWNRLRRRGGCRSITSRRAAARGIRLSHA